MPENLDDNIEAWGRRRADGIVEIQLINWTMNALNLPQHRGVWRVCGVALEPPANVVEERNERILPSSESGFRQLK